MKAKILGAGVLGGALACAAGVASAIEPDAQLSLIPGRGVDIVAGILDGTLDFGEAVLFAEGGLFADEGLFEDYLRDFLITHDGFLAEHGFLGAIIGGDGVVAGFTSPDGALVGSLLEISGNAQAFHDSDHGPKQSNSAASLTGSALGAQPLTEGASGLLSSGIAQGGGLVEGGALTQGAGLSSLTAMPASLLGGLVGN